jgi:hypothetical protein
MANTSTVVDNFDDNSINTGIWAGNYGTPSETGGRARITCDTGYSAYATGTVYTWDDVYAQLFPPALASATSECYLEMLLYSAGQAAGTDVGFYIDQTAGQFYCVSRTSFFDGSASPITYSGTTHAWMRILKSGSNILFQTAPDGTTWTTRRTLAAPAWLTAATDLQIFFECHRNNGTNNFGEVDNVNTLGVAASATRGPLVVTAPARRLVGDATLLRPVPEIQAPVSGPTTRALVVTAATAPRRAADVVLLRPAAAASAVAPVAAPSYRLMIDWNDDGDFDDSGEDVTSRTLDGRTPVNVRYGRDQARALSPISAGTANYELNNLSRDYSPENTSSPLDGLVQPGRRTLFQVDYDGTTYTLYRGFLDDFKVKPEIGQRSVDVTCIDALGRLNGVSVSTSLYTSIRTGDAIGLVLDAVGWPADLRDLDPGATVIPWWWLEDADALDAVLNLVDSEGPTALVTVDGDGRIVFRDRHHRLLRTASQVVQATWRSSGAVEPLVSAPADYNHGWKEIVNAISFNVAVRQPAGGLAAVWTAPGRITLSAGQTATLEAKGSTPFFGALTPVAVTDYTLVSGTVAVALSRTSGESTTVSILAIGGAAIVDNLQVRGIALNTVTTAVISGEDATSIGKFGRRSLPTGRDPVWASVQDAAAIIDLILGKRADRVPTISVSMVGGGSPVRLLEQLSRNLSDLVHVVEPHTGLDADCYVEQIAHTVTQGGADHRTTFGLEKAPVAVSPVFTFDVAGKGFNDGKFGIRGGDDPNTMFIFDQTGHGFDQAVFAT